jgi:hypothetical protein
MAARFIRHCPFVMLAISAYFGILQYRALAIDGCSKGECKAVNGTGRDVRKNSVRYHSGRHLFHASPRWWGLWTTSPPSRCVY